MRGKEEGGGGWRELWYSKEDSERREIYMLYWSIETLNLT
jgi:hypothetical protein